MKNQPIPPKINQVSSYMKEKLGVGKSFDVGFREFVIIDRKVQLYYVNGLIDSNIIVQLLRTLIYSIDHEVNDKKAAEIIKNRLVHEQVDPVKTMDEAVDQLLSGLIAIFIDGEDFAFIVDVRQYPGRTPEEPDTERVIRGARDGYTENIIENTALTRRRIRDERLRNEMLKVGERSKTDVCISYLQDIADDDFVKYAKEKIKAIEIDGIPMADKTVEEFIVGQKWNPYPLVRYTERPDVAARQLMNGHVLMYIDTSPSIIILPTTMFNSMEHAEEFRQSPTVGTFIRWIRILAILASLYLLPLWLLFATDPSLLPKALSFIGPNEEGNVPIVVQIILAVVGVEFLRMAAVHTPTPLATALGLIAAVLIGQIAIDVGLFSPEVILYVAVSAIGSYVTPSYELSVANKLANLFLLLTTAFFGVPGFMIGVVIQLLFMIRIRAFKTPYLWPFIPFDAKSLFLFIMRMPVPLLNSRPTIVHPKDKYSQPIRKIKRR